MNRDNCMHVREDVQAIIRLVVCFVVRLSVRLHNSPSGHPAIGLYVRWYIQPLVRWCVATYSRLTTGTIIPASVWLIIHLYIRLILQPTACLYDFITVCFILQPIIYPFVRSIIQPTVCMAVSLKSSAKEYIKFPLSPNLSQGGRGWR